MKGRYERKNPKKMPPWKIILLTVAAVLAILLVIAIICAVFLYKSMLGKLNQVDVPDIVYTTPETQTVPLPEVTQTTATQLPEPTTVAATEAHIKSSADYINFLVVGQAAREGETERFSDTMILCTVNTYEKTLTMTSLLRDSFVKMPDYKGRTGGRIKLTTIYHLGSIYGNGAAGSMELMNLTLYHNFGIEVDHNIEIDFDAFIRIIDLLGGIDLELTQAEADYLSFWADCTAGPGTAHLNGTEALYYARMRHAAGDGGSDIVRTNRQRGLIEALINQLRKKSITELNEIANEVLPLITTSMDDSEITQCLLTFIPMLSELKIEGGGTCPANYHGDLVDIYSDGMKHSVLRFNVEETKRTMRAITEGETP